ncbi:unnamed protein product [Durusdinium trenchii]|uniref:Uncharacterized protein n=1 Tax=Durusdinium trenchii TaxID=1381693 RepID=A0ABP0S716_9DINO
MAVRPESVEEWCLLMPNLFEVNDWTVALTTAEAALMHSSCAWGGHLLKFELKDLTIQNAPEDPAQILVRPEVRALHQDTCPLNGVKVGSSVGFVAPGEAIVEASIAQEATMKLCSVLFGDTGYGRTGHGLSLP